MLALLSVVRNEEKRIADFLRHHADLVDDFVLVDDNSTDQTATIIDEFAQQMRAQGRKFVFIRSQSTGGFCEVYLESARLKVTAEWVLRLDADELIPLEEQSLLRKTIDETGADVLYLQRHNFIDGKPFENIEVESKPRLFRRDAVVYSTRLHTEEIPQYAVTQVAPISILHNKTQIDHSFTNRRYRSTIESKLVEGDSSYVSMSDWYAPPSDAPIGISLLTLNHLEDYTIPLLDSLRRNTSHPFEICILDNGSTDGTREYLEQIPDFGVACQGYQILYEDENIGIIKGRNATYRHLLQNPAIEAVCVLHNDMLLQPIDDGTGWLDLLWVCMLDDVKRGIVGSWTTEEPLSDYGGVEGFESWALDQSRSGRGSFEVANIQPCLIRRSVLDTVGLYDEGFPGKVGYEDWDFNCRVSDAGWLVGATKGCWTWHKAMVTRGDVPDSELGDNAAYYYTKWGSRRW